jgi:hypothetical protein
MGHTDHTDHARREGDDARDVVRWQPPAKLRRGPRSTRTIVSGASRHSQRTHHLSWRAARLWGAVAHGKRPLPPIGEESASGQVSLSPGVWHALEQIRAADPLWASSPDAAPARHISEADALPHVAEERAPYRADTEPDGQS